MDMQHSQQQLDTERKDRPLVSFGELCRQLSISEATGHNWLRLKKLEPQAMRKNVPWFSEEYIASLRDRLRKEDSTVLKSRRNKTFISGNRMYHSYVSENSLARISVQSLLDLIRVKEVPVDDLAIRTLTAECAVQLLLHGTIFPFAGRCLPAYLQGHLSLSGREFLVDALISDREKTLSFVQENPELFQVVYSYEEGEDTLGLLYISLKNLGVRKAQGLYFTPNDVVLKLTAKLFGKNPYRGHRICDPCCGTGNFLLRLPADVSFDQIYGIDTDILSVLLARINLSLKYQISTKELLEEHVSCRDFLALSGESGNDTAETYDFILGNPPWGYVFSEAEKEQLRKTYTCTEGASVESYAVFIEKALQCLSPEGVLSFVLPEALLSVRAHMAVRDLLSRNCTLQYLEFLGNVFDGVQCPCIFLQAQYTGKPGSTRGMEVQEEQRGYVIHTERISDSSCFSFRLSDEEYRVLQKIENPEGKAYLKDQAVFALGIVTGDNERYLTDTRTADNETVLKGSDVYRFRIAEPDRYLTFRPEAFQQTAPEKYYRAPEKLLYRFICDCPVFAYDDRKTLSLNSCNLVIPQIRGMDIKYIMAILNSRIAQFYYEKTFHSMKVLRSHIEQIPIPFARKELQDRLTGLVDQLLSLPFEPKREPGEETSDPAGSRALKLYDRIDLEAAILYGLDYREYGIVLASLEGKTLFLER